MAWRFLSIPPATHEQTWWPSPRWALRRLAVYAIAALSGGLLFVLCAAELAGQSRDNSFRAKYRLRRYARLGRILLGSRSVASAVIQTEGTGQRSSFARIASADWVQTKGFGLALCSAR